MVTSYPDYCVRRYIQVLYLEGPRNIEVIIQVYQPHPRLNLPLFDPVSIKELRMSIQNLQTYDPFSDVSKGVDETSRQGQPIHIRIQQRNGRKTLTTVQGISEDYDKKKLVKAFKKQFNCNGTVIENPEYGEVIQLQGDQRNNISDFLKSIGLAKPEQLNVHGF